MAWNVHEYTASALVQHTRGTQAMGTNTSNPVSSLLNANASILWNLGQRTTLLLRRGSFYREHRYQVSATNIA